MVERRKPREDKKDPFLALLRHEVSNPAGAIVGFLRMILAERLGPLTDQQRQALGHVERSAGRLSRLSEHLNELSLLEGGGLTFAREQIGVESLIDAHRGPLRLEDSREIGIVVSNHAAGATLVGDRVQLGKALDALLFALARELGTASDLCVSLRRATCADRPMLKVTIADRERVEQLEGSGAADLSPFDEYAFGGVGLSVVVARGIVYAHQGELWSPRENPKAAALILLPEIGR
jgi:signal transduction histidine kinase